MRSSTAHMRTDMTHRRSVLQEQQEDASPCSLTRVRLMIRTLVRSPLVYIALGVGVLSLTSAPSGDPNSAMPICDLSLRVEARD